VGEMIPPCGVPASVGNSVRFSMKPACNHFLSTSLSVGMWSSIHVWLMLSKQPRMSPSRAHRALCFWDSARKHCSMASAVERFGRKPYVRGESTRIAYTCEQTGRGIALHIAAREGTYPVWWKQVRVEFYGVAAVPRAARVNGEGRAFTKDDFDAV